MKDVKRIVSRSFWKRQEVVDKFTAEDKYFYLYLLTSPQSSQVGIYKFSPKEAAFDLSYSVEAVYYLLDRFEKTYGMIRYSKETSEVAIGEYLTHAVLGGGKPLLDLLKAETDRVEDKSLIIYIYDSLKCKYINNSTVREYVDYINNIYINNKSINNDSCTTRVCIFENGESVSKPSAKEIQREADAMFESLWKLYPRKKGKGAVKDATKRKLYAIGFDRMKRAVEKFNRDMEGRDIQYIMHGSRFFNSGYVDYLDDENDHVEEHGGEVQVGIDGSILE